MPNRPKFVLTPEERANLPDATSFEDYENIKKRLNVRFDFPTYSLYINCLKDNGYITRAFPFPDPQTYALLFNVHAKLRIRGNLARLFTSPPSSTLTLPPAPSFLPGKLYYYAQFLADHDFILSKVRLDRIINITDAKSTWVEYRVIDEDGTCHTTQANNLFFSASAAKRALDVIITHQIKDLEKLKHDLNTHFKLNFFEEN